MAVERKNPRQLGLFGEPKTIAEQFQPLKEITPLRPAAVDVQEWRLSRIQASDKRLDGVPPLRKANAVTFFSLGKRLFFAKEDPSHMGLFAKEDIIKPVAGVGLYEFAEGGPHLVAYGGIYELTSADKGLFGYGAGKDAIRRGKCAELSISLSKESLERPEDNSRGFATRLTEVLLEIAAKRGVDIVFAKLMREEFHGPLNEHNRTSEHILQKLGFLHTGDTGQALLMMKRLRE